MFSGIVRAICPVNSVDISPSGLRLTLGFQPYLLQGLETGASISVNGVCLTVVSFSISESSASFDVVPETLKRSNLLELETGSMLNIERSLKFGDEVGGHLCSGHVDTMSIVSEIVEHGEGAEIDFSVAQEWEKYIFEKGYITLNGASLTVAKKLAGSFRVAFIPETRSKTNLGALQIGSRVNVEIDRATQAIVETVERVLEQRPPRCS